MVTNSAAEGKHHLSGSLSSEPPELEPLQQRVAPKPKHRSTSASCRYRTHFPTFNCKEDCRIITDTAAQLELSGFYWGPLGVEEAHRMLKDAPKGSYLIRDSRQKDVFFTLSYHAKGGPVSVRIDYKRQKFSLSGNERTFPTLFDLLEHYTNSPKRTLRVPYRKWEPTLQELCRRRIMELCGGGKQVSELPLTNIAQGFLLEFPYKL
ncbi:suppressor of cytokine signaling 1a [Corythoichthys intestinalis]|uniref:suppressor of cytokine signaling 1a n=1 Tax=Corythoichthys intestinalis TaxID=161448 RepID=UPI0025A4EB72|nr:suppressor of cytokine signaling 1a [Corythoichthys intestinalis]XP_061805252.1 suppressor of cytokine signaling 1-like [Nerophis lumbriciformis]